MLMMASTTYTGINHGLQIGNNHGPITAEFHVPPENFSFRGPIGVCLGQAPYIAPELFVGRSSELHEMAHVLQPLRAPQKQQRLLLGGMGGVGKTQLAIAYAESYRGSYSSIFWLNAASEAALKDSFRLVASLIFSVRDTRVLEGDTIVGRVHRWLSDLRNTGWLLIFDNYDVPGQFEINDYYPPASHGAVVVTTRRAELVAGSTLHIKPLQNIEDGLVILQTRSKRDSVQSDPYAKRLAERLDGLPLALATAGTYIQRTGFTFERYLQEYEKHWNIDPRRPTKLQEYRERTLYTTWDLSYDHLKIEDPDAAKLLRLLAYFDNQSLWYELFRGGLTNSSPEWLREVVANDVTFHGVMGILTQYDFLEVDKTSGSWSMHHCVHDWTLAALNKDVDIDHYWYAFDSVDASAAGVTEDTLGHISSSRLAGHATRLVQLHFFQNNIISDFAPDRLNKASHIARLLQDQFQLDEAEQMYMRALAGREKALGPDRPSTLHTVNSLGILYDKQNKLVEAERMYTRALAGREKALGPDHPSTLHTVNSLGILYDKQNKFVEAERMYMWALAGREKALGPDHPSTLHTVNSLGILYCNQGKLVEAEQMYMRALAGREKALGTDHLSTLHTVNSLGILYCKQGKLVEAEQMYMRALAGREKALGTDHPSTLHTVNSLGILYREQGKLEKAERMFMRAGAEK